MLRRKKKQKQENVIQAPSVSESKTVKAAPLRCLYYKGVICIMTPDESNPNPLMTVGCPSSLSNIIRTVYNIKDEEKQE